MTCVAARSVISERLDGDDHLDETASEQLDDHLATCAACRDFEDRARSIRAELRYESFDRLPDVVDAVRGRIEGIAPAAAPTAPRPRRRNRILAIAAGFVVGALVGAALVTTDGTRPGPSASADIPTEVAAAQFDVDALSARLELVERGWHPDVPERRWTGSLSWRAPEQLVLELDDRTSYPSADWVPDDVVLVVDEDRAWASGPRDCPADQQPACSVLAPRVEEITGREPFAEDAAVPLDLVVPVRSFAGAHQPTHLGERTIAGRPAVGVRTTAAQVQPVLDGLRPAGNRRDVHPADPVELWLDTETMVPLGLDVEVGTAPDRVTWAANRGYRDEPGEVVISLTVTSVDYDPPALQPDAAPSDPTSVRDAGFVDGPSTLLDLSAPRGFTAHRSGRVSAGGPVVEVVAWTDGRGWVKVRATSEWSAPMLFGGLGEVVRTVDLGPAGTAYSNDRGDRLALHTDELDVVVEGSLGEDRLRRIAGDLGLVGQPVPSTWRESASATPDKAAGSLPGLLLPGELDGFGPPSLLLDDGTVVVSYAGPGARAFQLTQAPGARLSPPLDLSVTAVEVRGQVGRWSGSRGELEWTEDGHVLTLRSTTLSLGELLTIASDLETT